MCIFLLPDSHAALTGLSGVHVDVALKLRGTSSIGLNVIPRFKLLLTNSAGIWAFEYIQGWSLNNHSG